MCSAESVSTAVSSLQVMAVAFNASYLWSSRAVGGLLLYGVSGMQDENGAARSEAALKTIYDALGIAPASPPGRRRVRGLQRRPGGLRTGDDLERLNLHADL